MSPIPPALLHFDTSTALAEAAAKRWLEFLRLRHSAGDLPGSAANRQRQDAGEEPAATLPPPERPFCVALSGGRIARAFYGSLVRQTAGDKSLWRTVEFFFADERWVPLDHPDSNYRLAREHLFDPLEIPTAHRHALAGGPDREFTAAQAQAELVRRAPSSVGGQPILDLVILGMGEDGHVASLFPGASPEVVESRKVFLPVNGPKPPPERLTLTYSVLADAREVWVLISGDAKRDALRKSLMPDGTTPLARVLQSRERTVLFSDVEL
jgi:6-phosphogluconolactonase